MRCRREDGEIAATKTASQKSQARLFSTSSSCFGAARTTLRPSYGMGMWRVVVLLACLSATQAALFTEGGAVQNGPAANRERDVPDLSTEQQQDVYKQIMEESAKEEQRNLDEALREQYRSVYDPVEARRNQELYDYYADMAMKLQEEQNGQKDALKSTFSRHGTKNSREGSKRSLEDAKPKPAEEPFDLEDLLKGEMMLEEEIAKEADFKKTQDELAKNTEAAKVNVESLESAMQTATGEPQVPQKKGQNEFVSFVEPEPQPAKQTVSAQLVDKRRLATSAEYSGNAPRYSSSSLLLLAVGTVMCVGLVGTVAGGTYYYKNNRRSDTPDDGEYAPYAGTGPGFRKNKGNKGDETLAYKAQLHQYQQAKQKIICGEDAPGIIESDGEDGADEENNYSVYECPGLAPTGDIEVCNPNFAGQP
ncbi:Protein CBR-CAB-1 [Caenorhabditis briggsae]|nr:Protein CBR-CAB-1 [Caenorhabditis briggsae]ULT79913.1 hypothetical protein L3Y34_010484 [Caenorhabditis briggsae]ULT79914.1 hypothetical protein L3Y34_010484 [Caenorhabditis briggsae]UMM39211.1 hypothetical protein L5515_016369 [Caenorhabditis briggsae]UMM39212.1 hypothetical protein L5515_016369 [Caenorhabditis briggsae]UMM39213.1 hypothetical protein L5515_016369 [Caenorhabditis briggsae]